MNCPACQVQLVMSDRQGVEIDYCPQCRGVWLDRGELDKLIERSTTHVTSDRYRNERAAYGEERDYDRRYDDDDEKSRHSHRGRKRKSFLGDLFDFD